MRSPGDKRIVREVGSEGALLAARRSGRLAADLAVAAALISALSERPVASDGVAFGEIALSGEIRPVAHAPLRLKEAGKLGFTRAMVPTGVTDAASVRLSSFRNLASFVDHMLGRG